MTSILICSVSAVAAVTVAATVAGTAAVAASATVASTVVAAATANKVDYLFPDVEYSISH